MVERGVTSERRQGGLAHKWRVLISVVFGLFMVILDTTVVNVAFRTLQEEFHAGVDQSQWIISMYVMALGIATPVSGYLADRFGMKRIFLTGLALFTTGSFLCGVAPQLWTLVAARVLQGVGGGIALPLGSAFLFSTFPRSEQGKALGIFGIALVAAPALGPIVGGWLVDAGHWRWIFFVNVPIGALGVFLGSRWLREHRPERAPSLDRLGLFFSTIGFASVLYAASIAAQSGWTAPRVDAFFALGFVGLIVFAFIELRIAKHPLLDLRLFEQSTFTRAAIVGWVSVVALFGAEFLLPLYLQVLRGRSALETGVILLPMALASGIATPLAGRLYDRIGARALAVVGFSLLAVNTWQLSLLEGNTSIAFLVFLLVIRGLALGMTVQTTFVTALSVVPIPQTARASALINSTRQVVQAIAVAVLATILTASLSPEIAAQANRFQQAAPAPETTGQRVEVCSPQTLPAFVPAPAKATIETFCGEYISGLEQAYRLTFYFSLLAVVLGATLPGWPATWAGREATRRAAEPAAGH